MVVDGEVFVEVTGDGGHGFVDCGDAQVAEFRGSGGKDGELQLASDGEFALDRREAALAGVNLAHGDVGEGKQEGEEAEVVPDAVDAVAEGTCEVGQKGLGAKDDRADQQDAAIMYNTVLAGQSRDAEEDQQDRESNGGDEIVRTIEPVLVAGEEKVSEAGYGDQPCAASKERHDAAQPACAQFAEGEEAGDERQVGNETVQIVDDGLHPARQQCDEEGAIVEALNAIDGAPDTQPEDGPPAAGAAPDRGNDKRHDPDGDETRAGDEIDHFADKARVGLAIGSHGLVSSHQNNAARRVLLHRQHDDGGIVAKLSVAV